MNKKSIVVLACECTSLTEEQIFQAEHIFDANVWQKIKKRPPQKLKQSVAAQLALVYAVNMINDALPHNVKTEYLPNGKPFLKSFPNLHISKSHSGELAGAAVGVSPLGLDVQVQAVFKNRLAECVLCKNEIEFITHADNPDEMFTRLFCAKEAWGKVSGAGLTGSKHKELIPSGKDLLCMGEDLQCTLWKQDDITCCFCGNDAPQIHVFKAVQLAEWFIKIYE
ncbi:MAG: 4'-phosphopantetheinyl transferase superfamily protein [Oscillospiraceae bacterium]|nr:4'-phosphopantetheinyl transferase superfamily protein [Oscillospiraceae bacterium]